MGTIYRRGDSLWLGFKDASGKWRYKASGLGPGEEQKAKKLLERIEAKVAAGLAHGAEKQGPVTVARFADPWIEERRKLGLADADNDQARLRYHILPILGEMRLDQVRPRHVADLVKALRTSGKLAPKSIYNVYSVMKALFRDAHLADLIDSSPCVLTKYQLGENEDKNPEWRATAIYSRDELEMLIADPRIPTDRQMLYALEGIGGLRHGEAAGLRWRHYDATLDPLGRLIVATSYDKGRTKTKRTRYMPVHPTLAAMLAEWKLGGWTAMMGRAPTPEDLIVPLPQSARIALGKMRSKNDSYKRLFKDLEALGLRHRRGHDLRRTMISFARTDGARKDLLELCTHTPRRKGSAIDDYTEFPWDALCAEVAKLRIERAPRGRVIALPRVAQVGETTSELTTVLLQSSTEPCNYKGKLVEAPGVEPGSENHSRSGLRA